MNHNYIEKLRFTLSIENLTLENQQSPILYFGVNSINKEKEFVLSSGDNIVVFEDVVWDPGAQKLMLEVKETNDAWSTGAFKINDLKIHGMSVGLTLFNSVYFPKYDDEFYKENKSQLSREIKSGLYIGNRGRWEWNFESPVYDNALYKIGLW